MAKAVAAAPAGDLGDLLLAAFGKNHEAADAAGFISTGFLPLNHALSGRYHDGGVPRARIIEIYGPPSAGKTSLTTDIMIAAQRAGGFAGFMDHERSFDLRLGKSRGLSDSPSQWFYRKPKTFQESMGHFTQVAIAIRNSKKLGKAPIVWAFDSLASMIPEAIYEKVMKGEALNMRDRMELSMATSNYFPMIAAICEELDITALFLNQIRTKPGVMFGDPTTTPGGDAPKFYATTRIQLGATRLMKEAAKGEEREQIGSEVTARVIKNKGGYRPYKKAKWIFTFRDDGTGYFDAVGSMVDLLIDKGLIVKASRKGFYVWDGKERGRDELVRILTADPNGENTLKDMLVGGAIEAEHDDDAERQGKEADAAVAAAAVE